MALGMVLETILGGMVEVREVNNTVEVGIVIGLSTKRTKDYDYPVFVIMREDGTVITADVCRCKFRRPGAIARV